MKKINLTLILLAAVPVAMSARRLDIYTDVKQTSKLPVNAPVQAVTGTKIETEPIVSTEYWDVDTYNRRGTSAQTTANTTAAAQQVAANSQTIDQIRTNSYLEGYNDALYDYSTDFLYTSRFSRFHTFAYALNYYSDLDYYYDLHFRPWRFSYSIYSPFYYDPWYYDPFYYDPFYYGSYHYSFSWRYGYTPAHHRPGPGPGPEPEHGGNRPPQRYDRYISEMPRNPQRPDNPNRSQVARPQQQPQQPQQPSAGIVNRGQNVNTVGTPIEKTTIVRVVPSNTSTSTQNVNRTTPTRSATPAASAPRTTISAGGNAGGGARTGGGGGGFNAGRSR